VAKVKAAGLLVGCFQVSGDPMMVQNRMVSGEQRGTDAVALPAGANGQDGQVVVRGAGQVMSIQRPVKDSEPIDLRPGDLGQPLQVPGGRVRNLSAERDPQRGSIPARGGVHDPVSHRVLDVQAEIGREDLAACGRVGDQPLAGREGEERIGDDLAQYLDIGLAGANDTAGDRSRLAARGHDRPPNTVTVPAWTLAACGPSPMVW
jgi:hypothetical protein